MAIREGGPGRDFLYGTNLADIMEGKGGNDVLYGYNGNDIMDGDAGNDLLFGGGGNDNMQGGLGADFLYGGTGNDIISGDEGNDFMDGGAGNDTFLFDRGDGDDRIANFTAGGTEDRLNLVDAAFNFITFSQVLARATDVGANVVIDLGAGDSVTLLGVHEAQLRAVDFIL